MDDQAHRGVYPTPSAIEGPDVVGDSDNPPPHHSTDEEPSRYHAICTVVSEE